MIENGRVKGRIFLITAAVLWGLAGVCVKSITWGAMSIVAARSIVSLFMMGVYRKSFKFTLKKKNVLGALSVSATGIFYLVAIKLTTAGTAIVLQYIAPIFVFLYSVIFKKKKAKITEFLITLGVFGGIVLSVFDSFSGNSVDKTALLGDLFALLSGLTFASQIIIAGGEETDSDGMIMFSNGISFVAALPFLFTDPDISFDIKNIVWVLILAVFQYGFGNILFSKGIKKVSSLEGSLLLTIEPVFNPIPVAIVVGEMMSVKAIIGAVVVIAGVTLYGIISSGNTDGGKIYE